MPHAAAEAEDVAVVHLVQDAPAGRAGELGRFARRGFPRRPTLERDVTVGGVNNFPNGTDFTATTLENTPYTFTTANFGFSDPNNNPPDSFLAVKITTLPGKGTLTIT